MHQEYFILIQIAMLPLQFLVIIWESKKSNMMPNFRWSKKGLFHSASNVLWKQNLILQQFSYLSWFIPTCPYLTSELHKDILSTLHKTANFLWMMKVPLHLLYEKRDLREVITLGIRCRIWSIHWGQGINLSTMIQSMLTWPYSIVRLQACTY